MDSCSCHLCSSDAARKTKRSIYSTCVFMWHYLLGFGKMVLWKIAKFCGTAKGILMWDNGLYFVN